MNSTLPRAPTLLEGPLPPTCLAERCRRPSRALDCHLVLLPRKIFLVCQPTRTHASWTTNRRSGTYHRLFVFFAEKGSSVLLSCQFLPIPSMSRGVINSVKQRLSHPLSRIKSIDQWAVDPNPFLTLTTSAKIGKTAIVRQQQAPFV